MSASPSDFGPPVVRLPRTIKAIRAALPEDQRGRFAAELDDVDAGGLAQVVDTWWARALVWSNPGTMANLAACNDGTGRLIDARELFPDVAWPA
jgi:hypothetical protein